MNLIVPGQTLHYWLAQVVKDARENAGYAKSEIASRFTFNAKASRSPETNEALPAARG